MVNISDFFFKKNKQPLPSVPLPKTPAPQPVSSAREHPPAVSAAIAKGSDEAQIQTASSLYAQLMDAVRRFYRLEIDRGYHAEVELLPLLDRAIAALRSGNNEILRLCFSDYATTEEFLNNHVVNVTFLAMYLGLCVGNDELTVKELGIAGFVHDIGMTRYLDLIQKKGELTAEEIEKIKGHPQNGLEILEFLHHGFSDRVKDTLRQEHERLDGSGYPRGIKREEVCEFAQLIGLLDVYEALTHKRPQRNRYTSVDAIKLILDTKSAYSAKYLKVLLAQIGIFPLGTLVRLNTKEIAVVIKGNPHIPLRPTVSILVDAHGKRVAEEKHIDLATHSVICIEDCVKE